MLSFMREQGGEGHPGSQTAGSGQPDGAAADGGEAQDYLTVAANSRSLRKSTILVAVLVVIGLAGLGYMIHKSQPQAASARPFKDEEDKIEKAIGRLTGVSAEMGSRMDEIVNKFYEFSDVSQVRVNELVKNPFEKETATTVVIQEEATVDTDDARATLIRREQLKQRANTLKLLSVMRSEDGNACMINDRILRTGDTVEGFTITQIGAESVQLTWKPEGAGQSAENDLTIMLKLAQ